MYRDIDHDTYQRLHDAARQQALLLRQQAIDNFWRQAGRTAARALHALRRPGPLVPAPGGVTCRP